MVGKVGSWVRNAGEYPLNENIIDIIKNELMAKYPDLTWSTNRRFEIWKAGIVTNAGAQFTINGSDVFVQTNSRTLQLDSTDEPIYDLRFLTDTPINLRFAW